MGKVKSKRRHSLAQADIVSIPYGKGKGQTGILMTTMHHVSIPYGKGKDAKELEGLKTAHEKVSIPYGKGKEACT